MKTLLILILLFLHIACATLTKPDGLYINRRLVKENATVNDFCRAKDYEIKELYENGKVKLSMGWRGNSSLLPGTVASPTIDEGSEER